MEEKSRTSPIFTVNAAELLTAIKQIEFANRGNKWNEENRPVLCSVFFDAPGDGSLSVVATNGHQMAVSALDVKGKGKLAAAIRRDDTKRIIEGLKGKKREDVRLLRDGDKSAILVETSSGDKVGKFVPIGDQDFPNYKAIIPKELSWGASATTEDLRSALKRVGLMAPSGKESRHHMVKFHFTRNSIKLSAFSDAGDGEEEIEAKCETKDTLMALNYRYVLGFLNVAKSERVLMANINSDICAIAFRHEGIDRLLYLVMPIKL